MPIPGEPSDYDGPDAACSSYSGAEMVEVIGLKDQAWPCRRCGYRQDQHASWKTNPVITVLETPLVRRVFDPSRMPRWWFIASMAVAGLLLGIFLPELIGLLT